MLCALCGASSARAEIVQSNVLEWAALAEGNELINGVVKDEIQGQLETAALQATIASEFTKIHKWEEDYSNYLKTVNGYASSLKASTSLFNEGFRIFVTLSKLYSAIRSNPQGVVATMSMNNLYMETATEFVSVFTLFKSAVAKGGEQNMLTGAERSQTLWAINDKLVHFHKKLKQLSLSISYYTMSDVWQQATAGMLDRDNGEIARASHKRWKRIAKAVR